MTIRHRISLLIVLMFAALAAIGSYAVYQSRGSAVEVRRVTQGVVPSALASADLVSQLKDVQLATMVMVYAPDDNMVSQAKATLQAKEGTLRDALMLQARDAKGQAQTGLVSQAKDSLANYFSAIDDTTKMKAAGKTALAQAYLYANVAEYRDELEGIVNTLRVEKNREKDDAITALNRNLQTTTTTVTVVTLAAISLLSVIGLLLYRQIVRPLSRMQQEMTEIAANQDFTRRLPVDRMDEVGHSIVAFNGMIERIQKSSMLLKQKSADIQAMLQNMQQGILTVVDGAVVHPEYSAHLESIFETSNIAGRSMMELVFSDSNLGADALSQVDAATQACLGEDLINFAFNQDLLVSEIEKRMPDGRVKILDLSWSAISDENDVIVRLMLCVRDVTELRELAAEAGEQKRRLEIIGEILTVSQDKFEAFIDSSTHFINANERIIRETTVPDSDAIAELFRNMHTVKGNARTYNLQHLTNVVHETEQRYEALRRSHADDADAWNHAHHWDRDDLMAELIRVREAVDVYAEINDVSLGRKAQQNNGDVGGSDDYLIVQKEYIEDSLRLLEAANPGDLHNLAAMRAAVHRTLRLVGTESVGKTLAGVTDSLPSLAKELGKATPLVRIDDNGYRLKAEAGGMLRNVFMHLLRNALDHGIEAPDERIALSKLAAGTIDIEVGVEADTCQITLSDDGRGLALNRILGIARERKLVDVDALLSDDEIAHLIFRPGFSTAAAITAVSGRGVGMDAVKDFLTREGGSIELRFTDDHHGAPFRRFQTVISLPDTLVVDSLATDGMREDDRLTTA